MSSEYINGIPISIVYYNLLEERSMLQSQLSIAVEALAKIASFYPNAGLLTQTSKIAREALAKIEKTQGGRDVKP